MPDLLGAFCRRLKSWTEAGISFGAEIKLRPVLVPGSRGGFLRKLAEYMDFVGTIVRQPANMRFSEAKTDIRFWQKAVFGQPYTVEWRTSMLLVAVRTATVFTWKRPSPGDPEELPFKVYQAGECCRNPLPLTNRGIDASIRKRTVQKNPSLD
jgi:hypothetical protein